MQYLIVDATCCLMSISGLNCCMAKVTVDVLLMHGMVDVLLMHGKESHRVQYFVQLPVQTSLMVLFAHCLA